MPNTTIQLKKSSTPSAVPADLANGELAINFADGKLFYKNTAGFVVEFNPTTSSNYFGTVNANSTLLVADTAGDIFTIASDNNISIVGDAVNDRVTISLANDVVIPSSGSFKVAAVGGDEGGEIKLANSITNSVLVGDIIIDVYQNKLRFFESAGTNRGAFINLASAAAGVGTDLLATGNSAVDSVARASASAAFDKANNASVSVSDIAPGSPTANSLWWNSNEGKLYVYFNDGDSSQWVEASPTSYTVGSGSSGTGSVTINNDTVNATRYLVFANNTSGNLVTANVTTGLTFNPSSNNLSVSNTVFATHFDNTSDRNLKENIQTIANGSIVLNLNPVSFNWKATGEKSYGLIAQEVEPVIPEIVHTNHDGMKTIEYVQLISLLISVVQNQQQQIDDINRRLNNMPSNP